MKVAVLTTKKTEVNGLPKKTFTSISRKVLSSKQQLGWMRNKLTPWLKQLLQTGKRRPKKRKRNLNVHKYKVQKKQRWRTQRLSLKLKKARPNMWCFWRPTTPCRTSLSKWDSPCWLWTATDSPASRGTNCCVAPVTSSAWTLNANFATNAGPTFSARCQFSSMTTARLPTSTTPNAELTSEALNSHFLSPSSAVTRTT